MFVGNGQRLRHKMIISGEGLEPPILLELLPLKVLLLRCKDRAQLVTMYRLSLSGALWLSLSTQHLPVLRLGRMILRLQPLSNSHFRATAITLPLAIPIRAWVGTTGLRPRMVSTATMWPLVVRRWPRWITFIALSGSVCVVSKTRNKSKEAVFRDEVSLFDPSFSLSL